MPYAYPRQDKTRQTNSGFLKSTFSIGFFLLSLIFFLISPKSVFAAVVNFTGFETGDQLELSNLNGTRSFQSTIKRTGDYALRINPSTTAVGNVAFGKNGPSGIQNNSLNMAGVLYTRFYFYAATLPSSNDEEMWCAISDTYVCLRITSSGVFKLYNNEHTTPVLLATGVTTLSTGTWYRIEISLDSSTSAAYEVLVNGVSDLSGTGANFTNTNWDSNIFGKVFNKNSNSVDFYYDDATISDSGYPGAGQVVRMDADSNGFYTAWTGTYTDVDEVPTDSDTTYISSSTAAQAETVGFESAASAGATGIINAVKSLNIIRDEVNVSSINARLRSGSTDNDTASVIDPGPNYVAIGKTYTTDPADSAAWTSSDLDSIEAGVLNNNNVAVRVSSVYVMVDSTGNVNPSDPTSLGGHVSGSYTADTTPTLTFTLSDPDGADTVKYQIQIDDTSNFSSPVVDYTSALAAQGATSFTVGQAAGSGSYTTGSSGQTLSDGSYYWRVKAIDNSAAESSYSTANSAAVAFIVDATAPTTPGTPATTSSQSDTTPTWSWTASTDGGSGLAATPYTLQWSTDSTFASGVSSTTSTTNSFTHTTALSDGTWYFRVKAKDAVDNESSYSSGGSITIDATTPVSIDLDSPGNNSYTNSERPSFKWKATTDATTGLSKYVLEIDNPSIGSSQPSGDFTIDNIPTSGTADVASNKYTIHFENFSDSDSTNNYISVYTRSHSDWGTSENDGKLREGKVSWKVKAVDNAGNETSSSRTLFVDRTNPNVEFTQINSTPYSSNGISTTSKKPTIFGKITDPLAGGDSSKTQDENGPKVASAPKEVNIKIEKKNGLTYSLVTLYKINMDNPYYTCDAGKTIDNSKQKCDKYLPFEYTPKENFELGQYKITLSGKDKADNSSSETVLTLNIATLSQITTPAEKKIIEEETKTLKPEEKKEIQENLEITKPTEVPKPNALEKAGENITQTTSVIANAVKQSLSDTISKIASSAIGNGLLAMTNNIGQKISSTASSIGEGYNHMANNTPGVTKNILLAVGNGVSTVGTGIGKGFSAVGTTTHNIADATGNFMGNTVSNIGAGIHNTGTAIAQGFNNTKTETQKRIANLAFTIGEKTDDISHEFGTAIIKIGYLFVPEPTKIYDVQVIALSPTSAKISWKTNHPASGKVNYGLDETYPSDVQTEKRTNNHEFTLNNLKPDTQYYFEVMSQNRNYVYDANRKFKTPAK